MVGRVDINNESTVMIEYAGMMMCDVGIVLW